MCVVFSGYDLGSLKFLVLKSLYQNVNSLSSNIAVVFFAGEHNNILFCLSRMLHVSFFVDKHSTEFLFSTSVNIEIFKYQDITG
jgi:hypothetical protein